MEKFLQILVFIAGIVSSVIFFCVDPSMWFLWIFFIGLSLFGLYAVYQAKKEDHVNKVMNNDDVEVFYRQILAHKNALVPVELVRDVVDFGDDHAVIIHGGALTNSCNYQILYIE